MVYWMHNCLAYKARTTAASRKLRNTSVSANLLAHWISNHRLMALVFPIIEERI